MAEEDSQVTTPKKRGSGSPGRSPERKRKRKQAEYYQSDVVDVFSRTATSRTPTATKEVFFDKGVFLAVRSSEAPFYLCLTNQNIFTTSKNIKVRWLEEKRAPDLYILSYNDSIELESVLTEVRLTKKDKNSFNISAKEIQRIEKIIALAIKKENGELNENDVILNKDLLPDDDDDEEEEVVVKKMANKSSRKKPKATAVKKTGAGLRRGLSRAAVKPKPKASASLISDRLKNKAKRKLAAPKQTNNKSQAKSKAKAKKPVKKKSKKIKKVKEKKAKQPRTKAHPNQLLTPNTKIEIVMKDPCFEIKAENEMPEVSPAVYSKRAIRAVLTNDMALLRRLISDIKKVPTVFLDRSADVKHDAMSYAIMNNNHVAIKLLGAEMEAEYGRRCRIPDNILETQGTGTYKFRTLGHATKSISMSRGSKEGNNAFTKEVHRDKRAGELGSKYAELALKCGASKATVDVLAAVSPTCQNNFNTYIVKGVRDGHRKVAGHLIQRSLKAGGFGFNFLHQEVLTCSHPDELTKFKSVSAKKKTFDNDCATPLHFAAINPNPKILARLLDSLPEYNLPDKTNKKPVHYAAACEGSGPLELLLNKSVNPDETDNQGTTPLMVAARTGRTQNIEILMRKIKANNPGEKSGLNRRGPAGKTPLHFAAENGHTDAVKALVKHGADIQAILNAGHNKETALILTCKNGHFATAKALVELNAIIEKKDKLQKTALMHAVINGHYKIVCYLLRKGANPNHKDSSGNTLVHYAAAYGWWYCLRVLLKAGGSPNTPNDWKIPPLGIAIMTGNRGCADLLLEQDDMDINFKDDNGFTLVTYLVTSPLSSNILDELKHLVEDLKAKVDQTDIDGWTALHHLTEQDVTPGYNQRNNSGPSKQEVSIQLAETLLKYGCPLSAKTNKGKTAVNLAIEQEKCNIELVQLLVKKGCPISLSTNKEKENILHTIVNRCRQNDVASLVKVLGDRLEKNSEDCIDGGGGDNNDGSGGTSMKSLAKLTDNDGLTPLNKCVYEYYKIHGRRPEEKTVVSFENMVKALVEVGNADVNQNIQDVVDGRKSDDGPLKYKQSPIQMLAACNEPALTAGSSGRDVTQPLLKLLLSFKPILDCKDGKGRTPLIIAILTNNVEAAKLIINSGANVNIASDDMEDDGKSTPLVLAARCAQFDLLHLLLAKGASVTAIHEKNKKTALHYAASSTKTASEVVRIVKALVRKKANINALDENKRTPLHLAVNANEGGTNATSEVVEVLLEHGANVFAKDEDDCLPLHYAFSKINKLDDNSQMDPIEMATTIIESMKRNQLNNKNVHGQTPLHLAAYRGASISAMYIVERIQDYEVRDKFGNTPLATAMLGGYDSMCIMLIQKGANININVTDVSAEMLSPPKKDEAAKAKKFWQWKPTVKPQAKPTITSFFRRVLGKNWQGVSYLVMDRLDRFRMSFLQAVQCALEAFKYQMALTMIRKQKDSQKLMATNNKNQNLLHLLCLNAPSDESTDLQVQVAEMLCKRGLDFSRKDSYSCTAVTYAAAAQNSPLCVYFFNYNNESFDYAISTLDSIGRLPMAAIFYSPAFDKTTQSLIKLFMKCGGSLNIRSPIPYVDPAVAKFLPQPKSLGEVFHGASDRNIDQTPLILCIRNGLFDAVNFLLKNGADPNYPDKDMVTPLMHAVKKNDDDIVKLLLNHSYTIKKTNKTTGRSPVAARGYLNWGMKNPKAASRPTGFGLLTSYDNEDEDESSDEDDDEDNEGDDAGDDNEDMDVDGDEDNDEDMDNGVAEDMKDEEDEDGKEENEKPAPKKSMKKTEEFKMTSNVNLKATDSKARNVIHHVVQSSEEGTFENVKMLELLVSVGALLNQKDANGKTPLDYSMTVRSSKMTAAIQRLQKVPEKNMIKPEVLKLKWSDNIQWSTGMPDFEEDSKKMLQNMEEQYGGVKPSEKPSATVDSNSGLTEGGEVLIDTEQNIPYNALMTKVEVRYGLTGMNNFYKLQVIHQKGKDVYALFTCWGMIGHEGQFQCTPFSTRDEAVKEFLKVFKSKTGNDWTNVKNFEKQPKKYRLVEAEPLKSKRVYKEDKKASFESKIPSKLPSRVKDIMTSLTNHKMYEASMRDIHIDTHYMPTHLISRDILMEAKRILGKVRDNLKECDRLRRENLLQEIQKFQGLMDEVNDLSNEFYELIPHINFSYQNTSPLTDENTLKEAAELVANLLDYEVASKVILAARYRQQDVNPLDYVYRTLDCQMQLLNEESAEAQRILRYVHNSESRGSFKVEGIFRVNRTGEEERLYNSAVGNHMLLWHGSRAANLISIMKKGLLVAPPEAPATGYMFGKGIYFADTFGKSSSYCYSEGNESKLMLLCEVALGKTCDVRYYGDFDEEKHTKNFDSVKGIGTEHPDPRETIHLPQGSKIPLGEMQQSGYYSLNYNEFIVYDSSRVCLRYLVQFKMD